MTSPTVKYWPIGRVGETPVAAHIAYEDAFESMAQFWRPTGVIPSSSDDFLGVYANALQVFADSSGMQVKVFPGRAWIKGLYLEIDATSASYTLAIAAAHATLGRMDRVVMRLDKSTSPSTGGIYVKTGSPNATPSAGLAALNQTSSIWEIGLAQVLVDAAVVTIAAGKVTDERTYAQWRTVDLAPGSVTQRPNVASGSTDPTTTSTSAVAMANPTVTITTTGGDVLVWAGMDINATTSQIVTMYIRESVSSAFILVAEVAPPSSAGRWFIAGFHLFTNLAAGSHTFDLGFATSTGTVTSFGVARRIMALEVRR